MKTQKQKIYEDNVNLIAFVVRKFGLRDEEVEEIVQDTFLRYFEHQDRGEPENVRAFLVTTARNLCIDHARRVKRRQVTLTDDPESIEAKEDGLWKNDPRRIIEAQLVEKFLNSVKAEAGGDILALFYQDGLSIKQIAEKRSISVNTATSQLSRARNKFRERLQGLMDRNWQGDL